MHTYSVLMLFVATSLYALDPAWQRVDPTSKIYKTCSNPKNINPLCSEVQQLFDLARQLGTEQKTADSVGKTAAERVQNLPETVFAANITPRIDNLISKLEKNKKSSFSEKQQAHNDEIVSLITALQPVIVELFAAHATDNIDACNNLIARINAFFILQGLTLLNQQNSAILQNIVDALYAQTNSTPAPKKQTHSTLF